MYKKCLAFFFCFLFCFYFYGFCESAQVIASLEVAPVIDVYSVAPVTGPIIGGVGETQSVTINSPIYWANVPTYIVFDPSNSVLKRERRDISDIPKGTNAELDTTFSAQISASEVVGGTLSAGSSAASLGSWSPQAGVGDVSLNMTLSGTSGTEDDAGVYSATIEFTVYTLDYTP